jgi:hypothetical protein
MKHRNGIAALLAIGLLVISGLTATVAAKGPGSGMPSGVPSGKPSHGPMASHSIPAKNGNGQGKGNVDCSTPAPSAADSASPVPSAPPAATPTPATKNGFGGRSGTTWGWKMGAGWLKLDGLENCTADSQQKGIDGRIAGLIDTLNDTAALVGKIPGLDSGQQATLTDEINGAISDLKALQAKIDGDAKGKGVGTDMKALRDEMFVVRAIVLQVRLLDTTENTLAKIAALQTQATDLATKVAAAPSGANTAELQRLLSDMNSRLADATKIATPLPGTLLGLTAAQLKAGKTDPTIAGAIKANFQAAFDVFKATEDARLIGLLLK